MKQRIFQAPLLLITLGLIVSAASTVSFGYPEWTLQIDGEVSHPISLTLEELAAMPQTTVNADLYCYSSLVTSGNWTGVQLSLLLETAGYNEQAMSVEFYATDGYTISILITEALREDVIIAYKKDGQLLPETLRLVIPDANGILWISMIYQLTLSIDATASSQSEFEPQKLIQSSPTPQQSPTPQPIPTPDSTPSSFPSSSPTTPPLSAESSPVEWMTAAVAGVTAAIASASLLIYFKKRKR